MALIFLKGFLIGFILALPIGPGSFLVIRQGIGKPFAFVLKTAMMCVLADITTNIVLCFFGSKSMGFIDFLIMNKEVIRMLSGPIFIFIGLYIIRSMIIVQKPVSALKKIFFVALISPTTPPAIITFMFFFVGREYFAAPVVTQAVMISGVLVGELACWMIGILAFHRLIKQGIITDNTVPMVFSALFMITGSYFLISYFLK